MSTNDLPQTKIAVIGYGSQGRAHALNLRESGFDVVVGLRPGGPTEVKAQADGFTVKAPADAVKDADLVAVLTQREIANQEVATYKMQEEAQRERISMEQAKGTADEFVCAHAKKNGIKVFKQVVKWLVLADACIQDELDAHAFENFPTLINDLLFKLERGNSVRKQTANVGVSVVNHGTDALPGKHISRCKTCRTRANNANSFSRVDYVRHIRAPTEFHGFVGYVLLDTTDCHCTDTVIERTRALTEPVLRTNTPAYLG